MNNVVSSFKNLSTQWKLLICGIACAAVGAAAYSQLSRPGKKKVAQKDSAVNLEDDRAKLTTDQISGLPDDERSKLSQEAKLLGNKLYGEKKFEKAIEKYTEAIELAPSAIFYSNRAACWHNLNEHQKAIDDCTSALNLNPNYLKALHRRGQAYEFVGDLDNALKDYTVVCVLEEFKVESSMTVKKIRSF